MHILIVEDDSGIAGLLVDYLQARGHQADWASSGPRALSLLEDHQFDAMILDRGLPRMEGLRFLQLVREDLKLGLPVLILTARDTENDKLEGFQAGADDYVVKPFSLAEVEARLKALVKRSMPSASTLLHVGNLCFDSARYELSLTDKSGTQILTTNRKTLQLLEIFMRSPGKTFTHAQLEQHLWQEPQPNSDRLRQTLYQVRKLLNTPHSLCQIKTVHSLGYRLETTS